MNCSMPHCEKPAKNRGWCQMHYFRWRRHGDPNVVKVPHSVEDVWFMCSHCDRPAVAKGLCSNHYAGPVR